MLKRSLLLMLFSVLAMNLAQADSINVELGSKSARFIYASEIYGSQYGPIDLEFNGLFDEDDNSMFSVGVLVRNDTLDSPLVISIGTRLYYVDAGNAPGQPPTDTAAIAIGGELLFFPNNLKGLGFGVFAFVAPKIVTFMDADGFMEYGFRAEYEITKQSSIYFGYAKAEIDREDGRTVELEQDFFVGIRMRF